MNGKFLAVGRQFALDEVEVVTAKFFVEDVRAKRATFRSRGVASAESCCYPRVKADTYLVSAIGGLANPVLEWPEMKPEEEIAGGPACWLWDYLRSVKLNVDVLNESSSSHDDVLSCSAFDFRRSGQGGFFLPLSGGVDSASVATIVFAMCSMIDEAIRAGSQEVLADLRMVIGDQKYVPPETLGAKHICQKLLFTCYMGTENSSGATKAAASSLASQIGSNHQNIIIDTAVKAIIGKSDSHVSSPSP